MRVIMMDIIIPKKPDKLVPLASLCASASSGNSNILTQNKAREVILGLFLCLLQINDLPMASFVGTDAAKQPFSL